MIFGGSYAGGSVPDWRSGLAVVIFIALLCIGAGIAVTTCVWIAELFGDGSYGLALFFALLFFAMLSWSERPAQNSD